MMRGLIVAALGSLLLGRGTEAQDAPAPEVESCRLVRVDEKKEGKDKGKFILTFNTPYKPDAEIQLSIGRISTSMFFAIPAGATSVFEFEKVNIGLSPSVNWSTGEKMKVGKKREAVFEFMPQRQGVYRFLVGYDPYDQFFKDPRFPEKVETEHALFVCSKGLMKKAIVDDGANTIKFMETYHKALRDVVAAGVEDPAVKMKAMIEDARQRSIATFHPGSYTMMTEISGFLHAEKAPKEGEKRKFRYLPSMVDVKFKPMKLGAVRESLIYALMVALECLREGRSIAGAPTEDLTEFRKERLDLLTAEVADAFDDAFKTDETGMAGGKMKALKVHTMLREMKDAIHKMVERKKVDAVLADSFKTRLEGALKILSDPIEWEETP